MSKLSKDFTLEELKSFRDKYTKSSEGTVKRYSFDIFDGINEHLNRIKAKHPDTKIVGIDGGQMFYESVNGIPKVGMRLTVKYTCEDGGHVYDVSTSVDVNVDFIYDVVEDIEEYFSEE